MYVRVGCPDVTVHVVNLLSGDTPLSYRRIGDTPSICSNFCVCKQL